jgi:hypothetical protein
MSPFVGAHPLHSTLGAHTSSAHFLGPMTGMSQLLAHTPAEETRLGLGSDHSHGSEPRRRSRRFNFLVPNGSTLAPADSDVDSSASFGAHASGLLFTPLESHPALSTPQFAEIDVAMSPPRH